MKQNSSFNLHLKRFEANDFMGIDQNSPVIIHFQPNKPIIKFSGDNHTGKTSTMTAIMYLMGAAFNFDTKNFINLSDDKLDAKLEFEYNGDKYIVSATKSRITLKKEYENGTYVSLNEPKTVLRKIFGNLGISPMSLKEMDGRKLIDWFRKTFSENEGDTHAKETKLINGIKELELKRRYVNRDIQMLKGALETSPLYQNYEESLKRFSKPIDAKKEKKKLDELQIKKTEFDKAKSALNHLKEVSLKEEEEIKDLEARLKEAKERHKQTMERIKNGEEYINKNKNIEKDYELAYNEFMNITKLISEYNEWKNVLEKEKYYNELLQASMEADGLIDNLRNQLRELTKSYLPKVDGLEIKINTGIDNTEEEGIFYKNKSFAQLSESELWDLFIEHIWPAKGVHFIFCENISSLGSDVINTINKLVKEKKATIFATEMQRGKKQMEITISNKI